jgi:hypothetical protein
MSYIEMAKHFDLKQALSAVSDLVNNSQQNFQNNKMFETHKE